MIEAHFLDFLGAWEHRDLEAVTRYLDDECVYEPAIGLEPGRTVIGREAVLQTLAEQVAVENREILVTTPFFCGARGMWEWTAFQRQVDGYPLLQRGCDWFVCAGDTIRHISGFRKVGHAADQVLDKSVLLANIRASADRFQARLAPLSDAQLTTSGAIGTWSIKDLLAHLTAWHEIGVTHYRAVAHGQVPPDAGEPEGAVDDVNATLIEPYRGQSAAQVLAAFRAASQQVLAAVEAMTEADLFQEGRFSWMEGHALWEGIASNTFAHYDEHGPMIQAWLDTAN